jgi:hypothetical protein
MEGNRSSGSEEQEHRGETRSVTVKGEPPDRSSSESSDGEASQEPFACVNIKQEVEVSWVQLNRFLADADRFLIAEHMLMDKFCIVEHMLTAWFHIAEHMLMDRFCIAEHMLMAWFHIAEHMLMDRFCIVEHMLIAWFHIAEHMLMARFCIEHILRDRFYIAEHIPRDRFCFAEHMLMDRLPFKVLNDYLLHTEYFHCTNRLYVTALCQVH